MSLVSVFIFLFLIGIILAFLLFILNITKTINWKKSLLLLSGYAIFSSFILIVIFLSRYDFSDEDQETIRNQEIPNVNQERCSCTWSTLILKKNDYASEHRPMAQRFSKNRFILNDKMENKLIQKGYLVTVLENNGYWIEDLKQSRTLLTPKAKERLDELGLRFRAKISIESERMSYFVVNSMTRTEDQQQGVRNSNPNAATPGKSTHSFGVAFDINLVRSRAKNCNYGIQALQEVLSEMQKEGKILLCAESKCIHVTVCR